MAVASDTDEVRRRLDIIDCSSKYLLFFKSKTDLQVELIIYRQLLDATGIGSPILLVRRLQPAVDGQYLIKRKRKRSIGISNYEIKENKIFFLISL